MARNRRSAGKPAKVELPGSTGRGKPVWNARRHTAPALLHMVLRVFTFTSERCELSGELLNPQHCPELLPQPPFDSF